MTDLRVEKKDAVAVVTLNRPEKYNAFTFDLMNEVIEVFRMLASDAATRLIVLSGAGEKAFCTGADLADLMRFDTAVKARKYAQKVDEMMDTVMSCPKPTVAAVNGFALGGGMGLAAACDLRVMSRSAKAGFPAVRIGAVLPVGCSFRVMALIGLAKSKELMLTARLIDAEEALRIGLVTAVVPPEKLWEKTFELAEEILEGGDEALYATKLILNQKLAAEIQQFAQMSPDNFAYLSTTKDWKERITAFLNKKNNSGRNGT